MRGGIGCGVGTRGRGVGTRGCGAGLGARVGSAWRGADGIGRGLGVGRGDGDGDGAFGREPVYKPITIGIGTKYCLPFHAV